MNTKQVLIDALNSHIKKLQNRLDFHKENKMEHAIIHDLENILNSYQLKLYIENPDYVKLNLQDGDKITCDICGIKFNRNIAFLNPEECYCPICIAIKNNELFKEN